MNMVSKLSLVIINGNIIVSSSGNDMCISPQVASVIHCMLTGDYCLSKVLEFKLEDYRISDYFPISIKISTETTSDLNIGETGSKISTAK